MKGLDFTGLAYLTGIALVAYVAYQVVKQGKALAPAIAGAVDLVNPGSPNNFIARIVNAPIEQATGGDTLGTWLAGKLDPATRQAARDVAAPVVYAPGPLADYLAGRGSPFVGDIPLASNVRNYGADALNERAQW